MNFKTALLLLAAFCFNLNVVKAQADVLLSPKQAEQKIGKSNVVFIDIQEAENFAKEHIKGAINITRSDIASTDYPYKGIKASRGALQSILSYKGVQSTDTLIIYDNNGLCEATRLWWVLKSEGMTNLKLINGGLTNWLHGNFSITSEVTTRDTTDFIFLNQPNTSISIDKEGVLAALNNDKVTILDTRTSDEFTGNTMKNDASRSGRIPGSILSDWANCIQFGDNKTIKSEKDLNWDFSKLGLEKDDEIIVYCHTGTRSSHTSFILTQILGYTNVKNYDGSWVEWSYFKELPIDSGLTDQLLATQAGSSSSIGSVITDSYKGFADYVWREITFQVSPWYVNYFYWLIVLSMVVWLLEIAFPWRKSQPIVRKDFWIDAFYMFFNFYIFKVVIFAAFSSTTENLFLSLTGFNYQSLALIDINNMPQWLQLLTFFIVTDFIQWFTHVMLHKYEFLWKFHKVHHSVQEMGFAAHLRYHWMENIFYTPMKYIAVMLIGGFTPDQAFIIFYFAIAIGHLNHANIHLTYGPLKYLFNNPVMHLWHHVWDLPSGKPKGINFGISLSTWDYIFKTAAIPKDDAHIKLGFPEMEKFPRGFLSQLFYGFRKGD